MADDRARQFIDHELDEARLWPETLLQVSPSYARVASVDELADRGVILRETAKIFPTERGSPFETSAIWPESGQVRPCVLVPCAVVGIAIQTFKTCLN